MPDLGQSGGARQGPLKAGGEPGGGVLEAVVPEGGDLPPTGAAVEQNAVPARNAAESRGQLDGPHDGAVDTGQQTGGVLSPKSAQVELAAYAER